MAQTASAWAGAGQPAKTLDAQVLPQGSSKDATGEASSSAGKAFAKTEDAQVLPQGGKADATGEASSSAGKAFAKTEDAQVLPQGG